jgi:hypothetical protein
MAGFPSPNIGKVRSSRKSVSFCYIWELATAQIVTRSLAFSSARTRNFRGALKYRIKYRFKGREKRVPNDDVNFNGECLVLGVTARQTCRGADLYPHGRLVAVENRR